MNARFANIVVLPGHIKTQIHDCFSEILEQLHSIHQIGIEGVRSLYFFVNKSTAAFLKNPRRCISDYTFLFQFASTSLKPN